MNDIPLLKEDHISQIPALQVLHNLGYKYLSPEEALRLRGGRTSGVLLEGVLAEKLRAINSITFKGGTHPFSEGNIQTAIQDLKAPLFEGLVGTNEKVYDLLTLGRALPQAIDGDTKSHQLDYVHWEDWTQNAFHVTEEFPVDRDGVSDTRRPDLVLFVNGIPFAVIECKRHVDPGGAEHKDPINQAIEQQIRNQKEGEIPRLFIYAQLLLAISKNGAKYAATGSPKKFWATWQEDLDEAALRELVNRPLDQETKDKLFAGRFRYVREHFEAMEAAGRETTAQDRALFSLCRPERLLELARRFTVFDNGERKVARYQQYFTVRSIMDRIRATDAAGKRTGGVVWHTQGSGKSLTMVMLAEAIALARFNRSKIVLVTDRVDLDHQLYGTFRSCGIEAVKASTGRNLLELLEGEQSRIVTTVIDKFEAAVAARGVCNENPNIFVLVDESHRTQYGHLHALMRKGLPNACFIGFTGTPVMKKDRNTVQRFGGMISPSYTIRDAVRDKAVVPLLYEGRQVDQHVDQKAIDAWFERITTSLSPEQATDLKKKYAARGPLNKALERVRVIAWDIATHYTKTWQSTGLKAQLVAPDKATALRYKEFLDEFGGVSSQVIISGPDEREGETDIEGENKEAVQRFWKAMMARYGSEKEYNRSVINAFTHGEEPEIIIVVNKLTTGFDAPRNTVLYLCRSMKDHELLQTIARVNRLYEGKDHGYIVDYVGVLKRLDEALDVYGSLEEFEQAEVEGAVTDVSEEVRRLPQRHSDLWDVFKTIANKRDAEAYERFLADDAERVRFYERLREFGKSLAMALSTVSFIETTPEEKVAKYKADLKFFMTLRAAVRRRYAEAIDFKEYESRIQKLLDAHVGAVEATVLTPLVDIFDEEAFAQEVANLESPASKADTIAHRTKATIRAKMDEDPAFYKKFSTMLEDAIAEFKAERISDLEYLRRVQDVRSRVVQHTGEDVPEAVRDNEIQRAFFGILRDGLAGDGVAGEDARDLAADAAQGAEAIFRERCIVRWKGNDDVRKRIEHDVEELLFELTNPRGIELGFATIDAMLEQMFKVANKRIPG
ncbi:MAG: type I restriction endonuclease subunit R [Phycisphaerales bacterium JB060]